ncbi:MAG: twin-arginine translocase subunit TatC [Chloroflexi bacterium]|nr:twin-arginine translocase subunit TatC [Chloroflexota bacterium]
MEDRSNDRHDPESSAGSPPEPVGAPVGAPVALQSAPMMTGASDAVEPQLTLLEHLEELRDRLIKSLIAVAITSTISVIFAWQIIRILFVPLGSLQDRVISLELTETITTYFHVALYSGLTLAMPIILYQTIMFIAPGLTSREKRLMLSWLPAVIFAFLGGVLFSYFLVVPAAVQFLLTFGQGVVNQQVIFGNYISTVISLMFWIGVVFELPIFLLVLSKLGIVSHQRLSSLRKYAIVAAVLIAAVITPTPDPFNQMLVALPIILLYELGIVLSRWL